MGKKSNWLPYVIDKLITTPKIMSITSLEVAFVNKVQFWGCKTQTRLGSEFGFRQCKFMETVLWSGKGLRDREFDLYLLVPCTARSGLAYKSPSTKIQTLTIFQSLTRVLPFPWMFSWLCPPTRPSTTHRVFPLKEAVVPILHRNLLIHIMRGHQPGQHTYSLSPTRASHSTKISRPRW